MTDFFTCNDDVPAAGGGGGGTTDNDWLHRTFGSITRSLLQDVSVKQLDKSLHWWIFKNYSDLTPV